MKKIVKYVVPLFACAILALSLSACGKIAGSKYKCDKDGKLMLYFSDKTVFDLYYDGKLRDMGNYIAEKNKIICKTRHKNLQTGEEKVQTMEFEIQDKKKTYLKDEKGRTWTKIK